MTGRDEGFESFRRRGEVDVRRHPVKAATKILPRKIAEAEAADLVGDARKRERALHHAEGIVVGLTSAKRCNRCGRDLSNARSVSLGIGPDCLAKSGGAQAWRGYTTRLIAAHQRAAERAG